MLYMKSDAKTKLNLIDLVDEIKYGHFYALLNYRSQLITSFIMLILGFVYELIRYMKRSQERKVGRRFIRFSLTRLKT